MFLVWFQFQFPGSRKSLMKNRMDLAQGPVFVREVARVACLLRHYSRPAMTLALGFRSKISPDKLANGLDYCGDEHFLIGIGSGLWARLLTYFTYLITYFTYIHTYLLYLLTCLLTYFTYLLYLLNYLLYIHTYILTLFIYLLTYLLYLLT